MMPDRQAKPAKLKVPGLEISDNLMIIPAAQKSSKYFSGINLLIFN